MTRRGAPILAILTLLGACAGPAEDFPSLALRDAERVTGRMEPPPPPPPAPPSAEVLAGLTGLLAAADEANAAFTAALPAARRRAAAARGAGVGSEAWSVAQIAIADLEARRSQAMIALADLDRLYVDAMTQAQDIAAIDAARNDVAAAVERQTATIEGLLEGLR